MRITFVLPTVSMAGGIRVVAIYARMLYEKGHQITLISPPQRPVSLRKKMASLLKGRGWPSTPSVKHKSHVDGLGLDHRVLDTYRCPRNEEVPDADFVIATWWETAEWVSTLSSKKGEKVYFVQGHEVFEYLPVDRCKATYKLPLHKIVISKWLADLMRNEYGDQNVSLVYNAVDHKQFFALPRTKRNFPTIGFLYHTTELKGVDTTLAAIKRLMLINPQIRVVAFGAERPPADLEKAAWMNFHFLPEQHKIRDIYSACDVWVTASRSEGFNLPAMEAMACRTPVVATRTGWPVEAIVDGHNGYLVDIDNVDQIVQRVLNILTMTDDAWCSCSESAFQTVKDVSWERSCDMFEETLSKLAQKSSCT